jgi:hypothetical protein
VSDGTAALYDFIPLEGASSSSCWSFSLVGLDRTYQPTRAIARVNPFSPPPWPSLTPLVALLSAPLLAPLPAPLILPVFTPLVSLSFTPPSSPMVLAQRHCLSQLVVVESFELRLRTVRSVRSALSVRLADRSTLLATPAATA